MLFLAVSFWLHVPSCSLFIYMSCCNFIFLCQKNSSSFSGVVILQRTKCLPWVGRIQQLDPSFLNLAMTMFRLLNGSRTNRLKSYRISNEHSSFWIQTGFQKLSVVAEVVGIALVIFYNSWVYPEILVSLGRCEFSLAIVLSGFHKDFAQNV
jgi:hypothetical protein